MGFSFLGTLFPHVTRTQSTGQNFLMSLTNLHILHKQKIQTVVQNSSRANLPPRHQPPLPLPKMPSPPTLPPNARPANPFPSLPLRKTP